jgi:uncharacterized sporulation protein YeaH/YhbH (DUF444 family)
MMQAERRLAKSFFFFALQGLRRSYRQVDTRFIAHTTHAWQFGEAEFFNVSGMGGTMASSGFRLAADLVRTELDAPHNNIYLFYASDGENFTEDRGAASLSLAALAATLNFVGYLETVPRQRAALDTEMRRLFSDLERRQLPVACSVLAGQDDVWRALAAFFTREQARNGAGALA